MSSSVIEYWNRLSKISYVGLVIRNGSLASIITISWTLTLSYLESQKTPNRVQF